MGDERQPIRMHVHERDNLRVDGILRLIEAASESGALAKVLQKMCVHAATIAHADVVSVYVRPDLLQKRHKRVLDPAPP